MWGIQSLLRGFWAPDEARFVYVAGEMAAGGHFFVPFRSGVYYAHKPPLLFCLMNLAALPFGGQINGFAARFPSLVGAFLSLYSTSVIATRLGGAKTAWRSVVILSTSFLFWQVNTMGQQDALLTGFVMSSIALLFPIRKQNDFQISKFPNFQIFFLSGLCMGFGVLLKGPVAFLVPILALIAIKFASRTKWNFQISKFPNFLIAVSGILLPPAIWLLGAYLENPPDGYFREILYDQIFKRAAGNFGHIKPFWYYLHQFPVDFMPWTLVLPFALWKNRKTGLRVFYSKVRICYPAAQPVLWFLAIIVFFSIPVSKRNLYILAAFPAAAIIIALAWDELRPRILNRLALYSITLFVIGGFTVLPFLDYFKTPVGIRETVAPYLAPDSERKPRLAIVGTNGEIYALYAGVKGITFGIQGNREVEDSRGETAAFIKYLRENEHGAAVVGSTFWRLHGGEITAAFEAKGGFYKVGDLRVGGKRGDKSDKLVLWE